MLFQFCNQLGLIINLFNIQRVIIKMKYLRAIDVTLSSKIWKAFVLKTLVVAQVVTISQS